MFSVILMWRPPCTRMKLFLLLWLGSFIISMSVSTVVVSVWNTPSEHSKHLGQLQDSVMVCGSHQWGKSASRWLAPGQKKTILPSKTCLITSTRVCHVIYFNKTNISFYFRIPQILGIIFVNVNTSSSLSPMFSFGLTEHLSIISFVSTWIPLADLRK